MNRAKLLLLLLCLVLACNLSHAQITIGSSHQPTKGALLDLKQTDSQDGNSNKGLILPRVLLKKIELLDMGDSSLQLDAEEHIGLIVYNVFQYDVTTIPPSSPISTKALICPGLHVWDGKIWQALVPYRDRNSIRCDGKQIDEGPGPIDPERP